MAKDELHHREPPAATVASAAVLKALANHRRLEILNWLKDPRAHFPPQVDGDLVADGVCSVFIAQKLNVSAPTASEHLRILTQAGLLRAKRIKQWTFYQRDEKRIAEVKRGFRTVW
jgi:DNA-binding transcriptional ArsR family regulator